MGYFDIQVNGYGGVDFNQNDLPAEDLRRACEALRADGTDGILAAIVTETPAIMIARLQRLVELREQDPFIGEVIAGFHIEGPFLSPVDGYRGAHPADAIRPADIDLAARLLEAGDGHVRLLTLAPEQDADCAVTKMLTGQGVTVAAGHTDASLDQLKKSIDAGLSMMTHLGNGCPGVMARHDNIIQRVLSLREHLWLSFIADGVHVPYPALLNYLSLAGQTGRCLITTDAIAPAGLGPGRYRVSRWDMLVGEDMVARAPDGSHLLGSAMPMKQAASKLREAGLATEQITAMTQIRPLIATGSTSK